jgi:hypothetical protein
MNVGLKRGFPGEYSVTTWVSVTLSLVAAVMAAEQASSANIKAGSRLFSCEHAPATDSSAIAETPLNPAQL